MKKKIAEINDELESFVKDEKELSSLTRFQIGAVLLTFTLFLLSILLISYYLKDE